MSYKGETTTSPKMLNIEKITYTYSVHNNLVRNNLFSSKISNNK